MDDIPSFTADEALDLSIYGVPLEIGTFSTRDNPTPIERSVFTTVRDSVDRLLARKWGYFSDGFSYSDPDFDSLVAALDDANNHDWVGDPATVSQTLLRPLDAMACIAKAPILDLTPRSMLGRMSKYNLQEAEKSYTFVGEREVLVANSEGRALSHLPGLVVCVPKLEDWIRSFDKMPEFSTVFLGSEFHKRIATAESRDGYLDMLGRIRFNRAMFIFPDPLSFCYQGFLSRRETSSFSIDCVYPPEMRAIDGSMDLTVGERRYWDPLIKKKNFLSLCRPRGLDCIFIRADQFTDAAYSFGFAGYDRLLLQHYCVGILKPRDELFVTRVRTRPEKLAPNKVSFRRNYNKSVQAKVPLHTAKGSPLPRRQVPNYVTGDVYIAEKLDGVPFWATLDGMNLVVHVGSETINLCSKSGYPEWPDFEVEVYGEMLSDNEGKSFVIFDVFSIHNETGLPFWDRWNKLLLACSRWHFAFPNVSFQKYRHIASPEALTLLRKAKEGIVLIRGDSLFGSFKAHGGNFVHPVRYIKRRWTADISINEENKGQFVFLQTNYMGPGVYEVTPVNGQYLVLRLHRERDKQANSISTLLALVDATTMEYFESLFVTIQGMGRMTTTVDLFDPEWFKRLDDPLFYLTYPSPLTYIGAPSEFINRIEKVRAYVYGLFVDSVARPEPGKEKEDKPGHQLLIRLAFLISQVRPTIYKMSLSTVDDGALPSDPPPNSNLDNAFQEFDV